MDVRVPEHAPKIPVAKEGKTPPPPKNFIIFPEYLFAENANAAAEIKRLIHRLLSRQKPVNVS